MAGSSPFSICGINMKERLSITLYQSEAGDKLWKAWEAEMTLSVQQSGQRKKSKEPREVQNLQKKDRNLRWENFEGALSELQMCGKRNLENGRPRMT